ncbi:MAG: hypothetical protein MI922_23820, partial [Bacteroidales bacterium]|nr:hypothetical protein [Bacteroidales bacterium]
YSYGGYAYHKSSNKKEIELDEDIFVSNKFANNQIGGFGKLFMKDFTVEADAHFKSEMIHYYGLYTGGTITQNDVADETFYKQRFNDLGFTANLHSNGVDSSDFAYKIGFGANHFYDKHNNNEPHLNLNGEVSYMISSFLTGLRIDYNYYNFRPETGLSRLDNCWRINPYVKKRKKEWEFHLGAKAIHSRGDTTRWYFYPEGYLRISVLDDVIQGYLGVTGDLEVNNYAKLANENPYIKPTYDVRVPNTNHRLIGYAGVFGKFSSLGGYKLDIRFDAMEDAAYYEVFEVGNSPNAIENQYILSTDDSDVITISAEAYYKFLPNLNVLLDGKYSNYKLVTLAKPWHKPFFESNLSVEYSYNDKILTSFDMLYVGRRYSSIPQAGDYKVLNSIVDLNLGVEYKYSKVLTFFVDLHNLLGKKYEYWGQYPTQGFNFIVGATYKL